MTSLMIEIMSMSTRSTRLHATSTLEYMLYKAHVCGLIGLMGLDFILILSPTHCQKDRNEQNLDCF